jgi:hypothetical protein
VSSRVLHNSLDETTGGALVERSPGKVRGELEVKVKDSVVVRGASNGGCLKDGNIHTGGFDGNVSMVYGLAKKVVGADSTGDMISRSVIAFWLVALFGELDGNLESGQDVSFDVNGDL